MPELSLKQKLDALAIFAGLARIARELKAEGNQAACDRTTQALSSMDSETAAKLAAIIRQENAAD